MATQEEELQLDGEDSPYEGATIYLHEDTKADLKRFLDEKEIEYDYVYDSLRRTQYEALIKVAMEHAEEWLDAIQEFPTKEDDDSDGENYEQATLRLHEDTKREMNRFMKKHELSHEDIVGNRFARYQYESMIRVAIENSENFLETLEEMV